MSKITLSNVGSLIDATTAVITINANSAAVQTAFDNTLSRDGTSPNQMQSDFDMNSNDILNCGSLDMTGHPILNMTTLDMQGNRITNLGTPTQPTDAIRVMDLSGGGGGGGLVSSVFGRIGAVVAASNDYTFAQIGSKPTTLAGYGITDTLTKTVFGRSGTVTANTGDYAVGQVTGAAPIDSPDFTTFVGLPSAWSINGTSVLTVAAQLNILDIATGATGTGNIVFDTSPTLITPALGTPSAIVLTNATGTAASLTAGHVTTNANLTGDITSVGNATTLTNAPVIAKVLTGYTSGAGTVSATDSILSAIQKLNGNDATNANLTGVVTSVGNATSLGSFSSASLATALTDETGTGVAVFGTSPILSTVDARGTWTTGTSWTLPALTLGGAITGGGNNIDNVVIGPTTPLAGTFNALSLINNQITFTNFLISNNNATGDARFTLAGSAGSFTFRAGGPNVVTNWGGTGDMIFNHPTHTLYNSTIDSTTTTTGAMQTLGGLGISKSVWVGTILNVGGAATFQSSALSTSSSGGVGYATGAGGTVTQITGRTTGVTLSKTSGAITLFAAAPAVGTWVSFTVTNTVVAATDTIVVNVASGTNTYTAIVTAVASGSFRISLTSIVGTSSDSPVINFTVIKGVTS